MKPWYALHAVLLLAAAAPAALAQTIPPPRSPIARADITAALGWFNADKADDDDRSYNDWYNSSLYGGIGAGWYWTDNHKTEIDFGATTEGDIYTSRSVFIDNQQTYTTSRFFFSTRKLAISQQYQGYRNAWFHPHVAAGLDLTWQTSREERFPTIVYDSVARTSREVSPRQQIGPDVDLIVRPFAAVGFKAYMTQRSFFRSDMRLTIDDGIEEVLWRFGFGIDF
jgi:hypothetical protein